VPISRRKFITSAAAGVGAAAIGGKIAKATSDYVNITHPSKYLFPEASRTSIENVVVVMMENRSTDHFLGWWGDEIGYGNFAARTTLGPDGPISNPEGDSLATFDFGAGGEGNFSGHPFGDPNHSHRGGRHQLGDAYHANPQASDIPNGWLTEGSGTDRYALSYYRGEDLPVLAQIVKDFTAFDNFHCSWMGNTYPNRYYMHSAQSHGIDNNDFPPQRIGENPEWAIGFDWPTLWDYLTVRGITWKYYFSNLPAIALFGARNLANTRHITEYYADAAAGTLPQVSFVDPFFVAPEGLANDDHPHADIRLGQEFYSDVTTAYLSGPQWHSGAMFITYDEWGGFWDHKVPPKVGVDIDPLANDGTLEEYKAGDAPPDMGLYGFRVPTVLLSPYARATENDGKSFRTVSDQHDFTSILNFIAHNWGIASTGEWDPGFSRLKTSTVEAAFDFVNPPDPEVDVDLYAYEAPPEIRLEPYGANPSSSVSDLWSVADWIEDQGFTINTRFADALPSTR
jgi:phospholipase C